MESEYTFVYFAHVGKMAFWISKKGGKQEGEKHALVIGSFIGWLGIGGIGHWTFDILGKQFYIHFSILFCSCSYLRLKQCIDLD